MVKRANTSEETSSRCTGESFQTWRKVATFVLSKDGSPVEGHIFAIFGHFRCSCHTNSDSKWRGLPLLSIQLDSGLGTWISVGLTLGSNLVFLHFRNTPAHGSSRASGLSTHSQLKLSTQFGCCWDRTSRRP